MSNWFEDQIEERRNADRAALENSFNQIASVVLGRNLAMKLEDERTVAKDALEEILKFYHLKTVDIPEYIESAEDQMDYVLRHHGMMKRTVELTGKWYNDGYGPLLGIFKDTGLPVAILPYNLRGYYYVDKVTGKKIKFNKKTAKLIEKEAYFFYQPMPLKELGILDLLIFLKDCLSVGDIFLLVVAIAFASFVGILIPKITVAITGPVLDSKNVSALAGAAVFLFCISLSQQIISSIGSLLGERIEIKTSLAIESSMMMRVLALPVSFHRAYSPGELKSRSMAVNDLCRLLQNIFLTTGLSALASLVYFTQIFDFTPALMGPSIIIILITVGFSIVVILLEVSISKKIKEHAAKESGFSYSLITGIQKIKLAGAEKRIFAKWLSIYAEGAKLEYNPPTFLKLSNVITTAISLISTIVLYYLAIKNNLSSSAYFAFIASYGVVMGAFSSVSAVASSASQIKPILELAEPFLKTVPETSEDKEIVTGLTGNVEIAHVSFRYSEKTPYVLRDISLKIKAGDYVAIVGRTGCGKSTLVRLLLGFEKPESGTIYYDGTDVSELDLGSLRKNIGTVTQDGKLFQGDIYSNIVITDPRLSMDAAWEAAETAGIAEDIRRMPMGMFTVISEGQGGISGGQKQRLMIARAVAPKPKLLILDEATSALDNVTQKQVSDALDNMGCTRIVVAHRLSTIKNCSRIIVIDDGQIIEDGNYDELIAKNGYFAELVARQRLDA